MGGGGQLPPWIRESAKIRANGLGYSGIQGKKKNYNLKNNKKNKNNDKFVFVTSCVRF